MEQEGQQPVHEASNINTLNLKCTAMRASNLVTNEHCKEYNTLIPVTRICCSVACSTKAGASLWMGRKWSVSVVISGQKMSENLQGQYYHKSNVRKWVAILRFLFLTDIASLINWLSNNIHDSTKGRPTNRHLRGPNTDKTISPKWLNPNFITEIKSKELTHQQQ